MQDDTASCNRASIREDQKTLSLLRKADRLLLDVITHQPSIHTKRYSLSLLYPLHAASNRAQKRSE